MRGFLVSLALGLCLLSGLLWPAAAAQARVLPNLPAQATSPAITTPTATHPPAVVTPSPTPTHPPTTPTSPANAETADLNGAVEIEDTDADQVTGEWIRFYATLTAQSPISGATIFFQARPETHTEVGRANLRKLPNGEYEISYTHKIDDYFIRPFSTIDYRWEITPEGGETFKSAAYDYIYEDQRFKWNVIEEVDFRVHWYNPDPEPEDKGVSFAQSVIDAAQAGFEKGQSYLRLPRPQQMINIYIYNDSQALQGALSPNSRAWVAGHADPDLGVIVAALPPGPDRPMLVDQRIPHELMHVMLYQYTAPGYESLPAWLSEGLASLVELYPSSDYEYLLKTAVESNALIPMNALCGPFPRDASGALLSYAEAASFTRYLHSEYGLTGIDALTRTYANGLDCERGARRALGRSLSQLERNWRGDVLAENLAATAMNNLIPWIGLALIVCAMPLALVLLGLRKRRTGNV